MKNLVYFPEPEAIDKTGKSPEESTSQWLGRCTRPLAVEIRRFLNQNIACLPEDVRASFCHALKTRWLSALFELVVARTLQLLGGSLTVEQINIEGRRPDFRARFGKQPVVVEATAPKFDQKTEHEEKNHVQLRKIIESRIPEGWSVILQSLPNFGPSESKASLKKALDKIASYPPPQHDREQHHIRSKLSRGVFEFILIPRNQDSNVIAGGPVYVSFSDSKQRILQALKKKRRQVRAQDEPVLLAVLASGIVSGFGDFDEVLFGHPVTQLGRDLEPLATHFEAAGLFAKGSGLPTYSGVLAFTSLTPFSCKGPVLYIHPRSSIPLPEQFEVLERRTLRTQGIEIVPATKLNLLEELAWAKLRENPRAIENIMR